MPMYGATKVHSNIDGIEYLKEGNDVVTERLLTDKDLKKIRIMKLRNAVKKVDRKGFRSSDEEEESDDLDDEEGEHEMLSEGGESEMEEEGEAEEEPLQYGSVKETEEKNILKEARRLAEKQYKWMHSSDENVNSSGAEEADDEEMNESDMDEYSFEEDGES